MDEPTANLDILYQLKVLDLVRQLVADGLTAIAAIHDLNVAARYCDKLVLLNRGRVLAVGSPEEVLTPETIESVFDVHSAVYRDPITGSLAISLIGPADEHSQNETELRSNGAAERARVPDGHGASVTPER